MSTAPMAATCAGRDLALELLDPGSVPLYRLFRHPGGDWEETPEIHRNERVDPPDGHKGDFAVLYMGDSLPVVAALCRFVWNPTPQLRPDAAVVISAAQRVRTGRPANG